VLGERVRERQWRCIVRGEIFFESGLGANFQPKRMEITAVSRWEMGKEEGD